MRSLGIDIGRYSIKVVEVVGNNRTYEITRAKEYKILNIESSDQEIDIIQTLSEIAKEFDTDNAKVSCSIRQQYVSTRNFFFPFKERAKIHKSLAFELEDDMPLSVDKAVYDSKIIKFHAKAAEVIAMACVSEEIARTLEIFESGHIDPDIITPEICAVSNLYEKWDRSPEEVKAQKESTEEDSEDEKTKVQSLDKMVVHIGYSKTFVGVVRDEHLIWGRSIMWGC
jgi:general secretion pathway protein L